MTHCRTPVAFFLASLGAAQAAHANGWTTFAGLSTPRASAAIVSLNGRTYIFGGQTPAGVSSDCFSYCDADSSVRTLASLPAIRYNLMAAPIEGKIYVAGGLSSSTSVHPDLWVFNPWDTSTGSWSALAPHPIPTAGGTAASLYGKFYITTYNDGSGTLRNYLSQYDPLTTLWIQKASSQFLHGRPAFGTTWGQFIVAGGADASGMATNVVEAYDPTTDHWTTMAPMPSPVRAAASTMYDGHLYVWGGIDATGASLSSAYKFDYGHNAWSTVSNLPAARFNSFGAGLERGMYSFGGQLGSTIYNDVIARGVPCYANCDGSTAAPILNVNDFVCYLGKFAAGCK